MRSEAQRKADKKYKRAGRDKYKTIGAVMHSDNIEKIKEIAIANGLSASKYTARAALYCAINNIDLSEFTQDFRSVNNSPKPKT